MFIFWLSRICYVFLLPLIRYSWKQIVKNDFERNGNNIMFWRKCQPKSEVVKTSILQQIYAHKNIINKTLSLIAKRKRQAYIITTFKFKAWEYTLKTITQFLKMLKVTIYTYLYSNAAFDKWFNIISWLTRPNNESYIMFFHFLKVQKERK